LEIFVYDHRRCYGDKSLTGSIIPPKESYRWLSKNVADFVESRVKDGSKEESEPEEREEWVDLVDLTRKCLSIDPTIQLKFSEIAKSLPLCTPKPNLMECLSNILKEKEPLLVL
jgi:hypothetical protein